MHINTFEHLPKEAQKIRETVFMKEQRFHFLSVRAALSQKIPQATERPASLL